MQQEIIQRLSAGGSSGRATSAQKALEKLQSDEERVDKPFVAKQRRCVCKPGAQSIMGWTCYSLVMLLSCLKSTMQPRTLPSLQLLCRFTFPSAEHLGQSVLSVQDLTHGYQDRTLFDHTNMELEKGERVAIMGAC